MTTDLTPTDDDPRRHQERHTMTHTTSGTALVWIDLWEYQCCGTPLHAGDVADLTVSHLAEADHWQTATGEPITLSAGHHNRPPDSWHIRVHVDDLCEARATGENHLRPEPLSLTPIRVMKPWDEDWQPAAQDGQPVGWIMRATILGELPPRPNNLPYGNNPRPRTSERPQ